jgi:hypothetical protein
MDANEVKGMLDELSDLHSKWDAVMAEKERLLDALYTEEIKARMAEIETEFAIKIIGVQNNINALEAKIKDAVVKRGESVKGEHLHALFIKGRVSWDAKLLDGYAVAHSEILAFRSVGQPTVSIRAVK